MKRFALWASLVGFAIVVVVSMSWDEFAFWASVIALYIALALVIGLALSSPSLLSWKHIALWASLVGFAIVVVVTAARLVADQFHFWAPRLWDVVLEFVVGIAIIGILYVGVTKLSETTIANAVAFLILIALSVLAAIYIIDFNTLIRFVQVSVDIIPLGAKSEAWDTFDLIFWVVALGSVMILIILWGFWNAWRGLNKKIKVSGFYESAATGRKFRRITVLGPDGKVIVRVSACETGQVVVARPGGSPTGIGERIIISPTFQVKKSIWHGNDESGEWDTFELIKGAQLEGVASEGEIPSEGV